MVVGEEVEMVEGVDGRLDLGVEVGVDGGLCGGGNRCLLHTLLVVLGECVTTTCEERRRGLDCCWEGVGGSMFGVCEAKSSMKGRLAS